MTLWLATSNPGKVKEFKRLFKSLDCEIKSLADLPNYYSPKETGSTFKENALIKARSLHAVTKADWVIADDSGLEVEGLDNKPGVHSARYAGPNATDWENLQRLMTMMKMKAPTNRNAQFKCVLAAISADGTEHTEDGTIKGTISKGMKGDGGFGYDPVFIPEGFDKTMAELSPMDKNSVSHRARAAKKLIEKLFS